MLEFGVLEFGVLALGVSDVRRAAFWSAALGARRIDWDSYPPDPDFIVLEDPEGNRFCIVDLGHDHASPRRN